MLRWIVRSVVVLLLVGLTSCVIFQNRQIKRLDFETTNARQVRDVAMKLRSHNHHLSVPLSYYIASSIVFNAKHWNIDPQLVAAVILEESFADPRCVSNVGAIGLMQVMPNTAESIIRPTEQLANIEVNVRVGTQWLAHLLKNYDEDEALRRYLCGESKTARIHARFATEYVEAIKRYERN